MNLHRKVRERWDTGTSRDLFSWGLEKGRLRLKSDCGRGGIEGWRRRRTNISRGEEIGAQRYSVWGWF